MAKITNKTNKKQILFECQACGFQSPKWLGKCQNCGAWESFVELKAEQIEFLNKINAKASSYGNDLAVDSSANNGFTSLASLSALQTQSAALPITQVAEDEFIRFSSGERELDIVLGGGVVAGGLYLVGGSPGVGKSTLLLKISANLAHSGKKVLYVSGEESAGQIRLRAERLGALSENLFLLNEIRLENILNAIYLGAQNTYDEALSADLDSIESDIKSKSANSDSIKKDSIESENSIESIKPKNSTKSPCGNNFELLVIDSIQTLYSSAVSSSPGSVSQVREVCFELMRLAKERGLAIFIIGHITKDGAIAGPRILEHMVDCVLYFEGDSSRELRILRGFKNRFGNTAEVGIFEMHSNGLVGAKEASRAFFSQRAHGSGSALTVVLEGSRALVLEVQALVSECAYGAPKRACTGFEPARLNMLLALLERKLELPLGRYDVFVNIAGGIRILETAADLAVVAAILSSFRNRELNPSSVFLGEVSLIGDVRDIPSVDVRLKEAASLGLSKAILPRVPKQEQGIKCYGVNEVTKIVEWM